MTRPPVVAVVTDSIYPFHHGGKEVRYYEVLRRLSGMADVHVYTMKWWSGPRVQTLDGITYHAITRRIPLYTRGRRSLAQAAWFAAGCARLTFATFDVIEADHIPYAQVYVLRLVTWLRGKRLVVTWHEVWGEEAWVDYLGPIGRLASLVERGAMRLPDEIIAASSQTADRLTAVIGPRAAISVAPNGLDLSVIREATPCEERTDLVFVGRLLSHKRVDVLIDAVALLAGRGRSVTCRVIGQGPELDELKRRARNQGVENLVEFRADVTDPSELYALVKSSEVFAFPSVREGFGIALLEALACGLPVITSDHPDNLARFLVDAPDKGLVCSPTPEAFAAAIDQLLSGPTPTTSNRAEPALVSGRTRPPAVDVSTYDWDSVAEVVAGALGVTS